MKKREYKALAFSLALAAGTVFHPLTAMAEPEDEVTEQAAVTAEEAAAPANAQPEISSTTPDWLAEPDTVPANAVQSSAQATQSYRTAPPGEGEAAQVDVAQELAPWQETQTDLGAMPVAPQEQLPAQTAQQNPATVSLPDNGQGVVFNGVIPQEGIEGPLAPKPAAAAPAAANAQQPAEANQEDASEKQAATAAQPAAQKPVETPLPGAQSVDNWQTSRPADKLIDQWMKALDGRTIVSTQIVGASVMSKTQAEKAVLSRPGDTFSVMNIEKDKASLYETGLFYDLFPTFKVVPEGVIVTYHLLENPVLKEIEITGNRAEKLSDLQALMTVRTGEILNTKELHENIQDIEALYHKDGYILVKLNNLDIGRDGKLKLAINEGTLEGFLVKGNNKTKDKVILREMRMKPGDTFNSNLARRSMQRVYNLGFFEDVNIKLNPGVEPNAVVMEIDVVEKRTGNFMIGAGYSSADGIMGMVGIGDKNFRGTGDAVNITYAFSGDDTDAHGVTFTYRKPWLDKKETTGLLKIYNRTYEYSDYNTDGDEIERYMRKYKGIEVTLSRPVTEFTTNAITLKNREDEYVRNTEKHLLRRDGPDYADWRKKNFGTTRSITFANWTDTRDNIYSPTKGRYASYSAEIAGFGGDFSFRKFTVSEQRYYKVGHAQVVAFNGTYGYANGSINEFNQFRIGGQGTLRGYRDEQFRGDKAFYGTLEYRFPLMTKINAAFFTDFGGTWDDGFAPKNLHESIGVGLGIQTPVGPIRLDLAHGSQGNRVHFSVGNSF